MNLFFIFVFAVYFLLVILLILGWSKARGTDKRTAISCRTITVVVPFRNESTALPLIIADLLSQNYPAVMTEVILVDDHSEDQSFLMVKSSIEGQSAFRVLSLPPDHEGKKKAVSCGIENAKGDIIVTTDADCRLPPLWLSLINDVFSNDKTKMVLGSVRIGGEDLFSGLQALEFASLMGVSGATAAAGFPTICNGANLAFLRSAFRDVNGYEGNFNIPSGDDEFLLRKFQRRFPGTIFFNPNPAAVVTTGAQESIGSFVQQRLRWAGKWKYNSSPTAVVLAIFVLVFHFSVLLLAASWIVHRISPWIAASLFMIKLVLEFIFIFNVSYFLKVKWKWVHFLILQFIYSPYVILVGLISNFLPYRWKGRRQSAFGG